MQVPYKECLRCFRLHQLTRCPGDEAGAKPLLHVCFLFETIQDVQNSFRVALVDQVNSTLAFQLRMPRVEPCSDFFSGIEFLKPSDNIVEVRKYKLRMRSWLESAVDPSRYSCLRDTRYVCDVSALQTAVTLQFNNISGDSALCAHTLYRTPFCTATCLPFTDRQSTWSGSM